MAPLPANGIENTGVEVVDKIIGGEDRKRRENRPQQIHLLRNLCDLMLTGSLCAMGGMTPFPVLSALNHFPEDFVADTATHRAA